MKLPGKMQHQHKGFVVARTPTPPGVFTTPHTPSRWSSPWLLTALLGVGVFVGGFDQTFVVTVLPDMQRDLNVSVDKFGQLSWVINGYLLGYTVAMPIMGRVADVYGHARVYVLSMLIFMFGSVAVALAPNLWTLVAARAVSAVGGGAMVPVGMVICADVLPRARRPLAVAIISTLDDMSSLLGPLWGAVIGAWIGWRALFWLNIILALPVLAAVLLLLRRVPLAEPRVTAQALPRQPVDWRGGLLLAAALGALTIGLTDDGAHPRSAAATLAILGVAAVLFGGFAWWELTARMPMIDLRMFRNPRLSVTNTAFFLEGGALITAMVNVPLMTQVLFGGDELDGGLNFMRMVLFMPIGGVLGGLLAMRLGFRATALLGFLGAALGLFLMRAWPVPPAEAQLWSALAVAGLGFTLSDAPLYATVIDTVDHSRRAAAAALLQVMQTTGMIVGMALLASQGLATFNRRAAEVFRQQGFAGDGTAYQRVMHQTFDDTFVFAIVAMLGASVLALGLSGSRARRFRLGSAIEED